MSEDNTVRSATEVKAELGRGTVHRVQRHHSGGGNPREPEFKAARINFGKPNPAKLEMGTVFEQNPGAVSTYRAAGMSDTEIFNILNENH